MGRRETTATAVKKAAIIASTILMPLLLNILLNTHSSH
jgi:hypothetical protein